VIAIISEGFGNEIHGHDQENKRGGVVETKKRWRFLIVGLGDIGEHVLEILVRTPNVDQIDVIDVANDDKLRKTYSAQVGALQQGFSPKVTFEQLDVSDEDQTAEYIRKVDPHCVISSTSLLSWWVPQSKLPPDVFQRIDEAGFGPWFPFHFTVIYKLMRAMKEAGSSAPVVNCSYPDATNAALAKVNLAPAIGVGNCDLFFPQMRWMTVEHLGGSPEDVEVYFVGDHYMAHVLNQFQSTSGVPYFLKILYRGRDVTEELAKVYGGKDEIVVNANKYMPKGAADHFLVGSSAVKNAMALLQGSNRIEYSPGPCGLPGGYPIRFSNGEVAVKLPDEISLEEAIHINQVSGRGDGVEEIREDGTVVLTDKAHGIMREEMGFEMKEFVPSQCEKDAKALLDCFWRLVKKHKAST